MSTGFFWNFIISSYCPPICFKTTLGCKRVMYLDLLTYKYKPERDAIHFFFNPYLRSPLRTATALKSFLRKKKRSWGISSKYNNYSFPVNKQLLDEVFVISGIIKVEVSVISRSRRLRPITLTESLTISDINKTESHNCFIIHCFRANNDKRVIASNTVYFRQAMFLREVDIALGNHALRAQPTDYSLIC